MATRKNAAAENEEAKEPEETVEAAKEAQATLTVTAEQLKAMIDEAVAEKLKAAQPEKKAEPIHMGGRAFMPAGPKKMVKVKLFRDNNHYKDAVYVAVNGESYMVPRGVEVDVPDYIARVLQNSIDEDQRTAEMVQQKVDNFREKGK